MERVVLHKASVLDRNLVQFGILLTHIKISIRLFTYAGKGVGITSFADPTAYYPRHPPLDVYIFV